MEVVQVVPGVETPTALTMRLAEAMADGGGPPRDVQVKAERDGAEPVAFTARVRIDTPQEADYFRHGGILQYVLRGLLAA